ncbi:hypothetical protein ACSBR2_029314 [Camellia fascicularis]
MEEQFMRSMWPYEEIGHMMVDLEGSACGLLCVLRPQVFELQDCSSNKHFLLLSGTSSHSFDCVIVNIYAPNEVLQRKKLWDSLVNLHSHYPNPWCVGRDFNEIRFLSERKGCSRIEKEMKEFNELVEQLELTDLPTLGRQYTWCNALEGDRWSRIDRFLLDSPLLERFSFEQWGLPRTISDQCPILLKEDDRDWGYKPFKFINAWTKHPTFLAEVKKIWEDTQVTRWARFRLMRKLYFLRNHLRVWNREVFGNIDANLKSAEQELHEWDLKAESRSLDVLEITRRREVRCQVWQLNRNKERLWHQKSRMLWARNRDKNTRFFHIMASKRQRKNLINSVLVEGVSYDTIIFYEGDKEDMLNTKRMLRCFEDYLIGADSGEGKEEVVFLEEEIVILCWMPKGVVKIISKLQSSFLWGGSDIKRKVHLVKWREVTKSKGQGGLGVRDIEEVNECLLLKWWWRYGNEDSALWKSVVCSRYGRAGGSWAPAVSLSGGVSIVWQDIVQLLSVNQHLGKFYSDHFRIKLSFRRQLLAWEVEKLQRVVDLLVSSPLVSPNLVNSCSWLANSSGQFSVSSVQRIKTSSFLQRIEVLDASANTLCVFCQNEMESLDHLLLFCHPVWECWSKMVNWWDHAWAIPRSIQGLLHWWSGGKLRHWVSRI